MLATALATACTIWNSLQVVGVGDVPLHGVVDGVVALEEILARLLLVGAGIGVHVLIQKLPHVVGEVQDLEVLGVPGKRRTLSCRQIRHLVHSVRLRRCAR